MPLNIDFPDIINVMRDNLHANPSLLDYLVCVAEPPELYGPHELVIVLQTSDCYTRELDNFRNMSGVLGEP